ncbi:MAG: MerR family transcriptional regulator [Polaromonas sp.]
MEKILPPIPAKRYFTISEVSNLCGVKPHVLRYWEQEFTQLRPMKRRGNRRYYQRHEVLMIRKIRDLLYYQGFTINGARNKLQESARVECDMQQSGDTSREALEIVEDGNSGLKAFIESADFNDKISKYAVGSEKCIIQQVRSELFEIRELLDPAS